MSNISVTGQQGYFNRDVSIFGCLYVYGDCGITFPSGKRLYDNGGVLTFTGNINVNGGVVTGGDVFVGGNLNSTNIITQSTTTSTINSSISNLGTLTVGILSVAQIYDGFNGTGIGSTGYVLTANGTGGWSWKSAYPPQGPGTLGAFLRSDGTNAFWDNTPIGALLPTGPAGAAGIGSTTVNYYTGAIIRGYTIGGYNNTVAYKKVYRTSHSTDTTIDLGAVSSFYNAYSDATSSSRYAYTFDSHSSSVYNTAGKDINKFDMATDTNISFGTQMNANKETTSVVKYRFTRAYIFSSTDPEKFVFATETPTVASTSWSDRNSSPWRQRAYGDDRAYFGISTGYQLEFATESWNSWSPPASTIGSTIYGTWSTYAGYIYWKINATSARKFNSSSATTTILTVTTTSNQEENFHTGESKGYMVGAHNGSTWVATGSVFDYINDTYRDVASVNAPDVNSSAGCTEFGRTAI